MRRYLFFSLSLLLLSAVACRHRAGSGVLRFRYDPGSQTEAWARSELEKFLTPDFLEGSGLRSLTFDMGTAPGMSGGAFSVKVQEDGRKWTVHLRGGDAASVLAAAYTFLERGGYLFDMTGPKPPERFLWDSLRHWQKTLIPAVRYRGIRQHLNFPMDLSAWSVEEAKEYIRNLARMRFNAITLHSYPGQWYEVRRRDTVEYAGHFFYGDVHLVPDYPAIRRIAVNRKYFCIPEIEPYFLQVEERSRLAIGWLQDVIDEAKRCGMRVRFSFEPRSDATDLQRSIETVQAILKEYPRIDALEFITEEAGGWGPRTTRQATEAMIRRHFGETMLRDSVVMAPVRDEQSDLAYIYGQVGHITALMRRLRDDHLVPDDLELVLGIYVVIPDYARGAWYLARRFSPPGTRISLMPGHHSMRVAANTPLVLRDTSDWHRAILYSWIEFDGMMYIQQNGVSGIHDLLKETDEKGKVSELLFNHWRTAENRVTARYAAEATLQGPLDPRAFYRDYARKLGILPADTFARAMLLLDRADTTAMHHAAGFAFCWVGRWRHGGPIGAYPVEELEKMRQAYLKVLNTLQGCDAGTTRPAARRLLTFLDNRLRTTLLYIRAFEKGRELRPFPSVTPPPPEEQQRYAKVCNGVLALFEQYIDLYAEENADRGCAGNLVSLWHGPVKGIRIYREKYGGIPFEEEVPPGTAIDQPPLPVIRKE